MQANDARPDYLEAACAAARWIVSRQNGRHWPSRPETPLDGQVDLYYGNAGTILFFQQLAESTGDKCYRDFALIGAAHVAAQVEKIANSGLFHGLAGMAFALHQVMRRDENTPFRGSLNRAIARLKTNAKQGNPGVCWNDSNDLASGTAGIGLALLYLAKETGRDELLELAAAAGDNLLALTHESANGSYWTISAACMTHYPNFAHGTAGIGYFLAELHAATDDARYRASALAAGRYLRAMMSKAGSRESLLFHNDFAGRDLFYLGWCHGPAGTGRFFHRLFQLTNDPDWLDLVRIQATALMNSGIPERQTAGYWNNISRCCGAAGVGEFFLGLYSTIQDGSYLVFAQRIADYLVARAEPDGSGIKWTQAENRLEPAHLVAQTGLMQGAAGVALFLLHVDQASRRQKPLIRFLDDGFTYPVRL
jgi:lantibiotic modifying enzyme